MKVPNGDIKLTLSNNVDAGHGVWDAGSSSEEGDSHHAVWNSECKSNECHLKKERKKDVKRNFVTEREDNKLINGNYVLIFVCPLHIHIRTHTYTHTYIYAHIDAFSPFHMYTHSNAHFLCLYTHYITASINVWFLCLMASQRLLVIYAKAILQEEQ